jgi:L-ascorbate metabolism protein UlaG (beta-lactamase superfamily)
MNANSLRLSGSLIALSALLAGGCQTRGDSTAAAQPGAKAHYLANEGVLIVSGETRIVFDPLFRNGFDTYRLLPPELERALFAGEPPFTGLDAVFISHYHEDHFSPADILRLLRERPEIHLYAPARAVSEIRKLAPDANDVFSRVTEIRLAYKDAPFTIESGGLVVEAVRIPHAGWPDRQVDTENLVYRVTLDESTTVAHLGDADTSFVHFENDAAYWGRRGLDMAFPPYWYFASDDGRRVLDERLKPAHSVGIHVPVEMTSPEKRPPELAHRDLFVTPGEIRDIP